jgi:hypothetical protein
MVRRASISLGGGEKLAGLVKAQRIDLMVRQRRRLDRRGDVPGEKAPCNGPTLDARRI